MPDKRLKKKWRFYKIVWVLNFLAALILLLSYALPYLPPKIFPRFALLTFAFPILILINGAFLIFWLFNKKRYMLLSGIVLLLGIKYILNFYRFSKTKNIHSADNISLMSYNVRNFNRFWWTKQDSIPEEIHTFIREENPDIVLFQEYLDPKRIPYEAYPYKYFGANNTRAELAILSKYPIINSKYLHNNTRIYAIYADIALKKDTVRVFTMHLQSHNIPSHFKRDNLSQNKNIFRNVGIGMMRQQDQVERLLREIKKSPYKSILAGDTNNSVFSYTYRQLTTNLEDAFGEAGHGLGRTFYFNHIPIRMDLILADPTFQINNFKTYDVRYSDHFPISCKFQL